MAEMDIPAQIALAEATFPAQWAATLGMPGDRRRKRQATLRKAAIRDARLNELRPTGASCGTCRHFERRHMAPGFRCGWQSDNAGDALVTADHLCVDFAKDPTHDR